MEEKEIAGIEALDFSLIDVLSENDSLIVDPPSSSTIVARSDHESSEALDDPRSFELSRALGSDQVVNTVETSWQSEQLPDLLKTSEPEITRNNRKCNLRKSLAWNSAFFTSAGVLDPEELSSMIKGGEKRQNCLLPVIEENTCNSSDSISILESDDLMPESLEAELFEDIRASIQRSNKTSKGENSKSKVAAGDTFSQASNSSKMVDLTSRKRSNSKPPSKKQTSGMQGSGKVIRQGSTSSQLNQSLRSGNISTSLPKPTKAISRVNPNSATTKRASMGANCFKNEDDATKASAVSSKGPLVPKVSNLGTARRVLPKPAPSSKPSSSGPLTTSKAEPRFSSSSCDSSSSSLSENTGKSPSNSVKRSFNSKTCKPLSSDSNPKTLTRQPLRTKMPTRASSLSTFLVSSKLSPSISPASSISEWSAESSSSTSTINLKSQKSRTSIDTSSCKSLDGDTLPQLNLKTFSNPKLNGPENQVAALSSQNIKEASVQNGAVSRLTASKPSGLRMPSPKIGFFDGAKSIGCTPSSGIQSHSGSSIGLPKMGSEVFSPSGSRTKVGKLPRAITSTITNLKLDGQSSASPKSFRASSALGGVKPYPTISPKPRDKTSAMGCLKVKEVGTGGLDGAEHVMVSDLCIDKNENLGVSKTELGSTIRRKTNLEDNEMVPFEGNALEEAIQDQHHPLSRTHERATIFLEGDQVDGLSRHMSFIESKPDVQEMPSIGTISQFDVSCLDSETSKLSSPKELFVTAQKEECCDKILDPASLLVGRTSELITGTRTPFALKNSSCNFEGIDSSKGSSIEAAENVKTISSSFEHGAKENN